MDAQSIRTKLDSFGWEVIMNVDPNPDNLVGAAILHCKMGQVGCLLRLEPNRPSQMYRLTIRSSKDGVSKILCDLLQEHF